MLARLTKRKMPVITSYSIHYTKLYEVGIVTKPYVNITKLGLIVELEKDNKISRIPEEEVCNIDGVMLKHINLNPFEISAVEKLKTIRNNFV